MNEECGAALARSPLQTPCRQGRLFSCCFQEAICWFLSKRKACLPPSLPFFFKQKLSRPCELLRSVSTVALSLGNWLSEVARELLEVSLLLIKWNSWIGNRFQILCDSSSFLHNLCDSKASSAMCPCSSLCIHGNQGLDTHTHTVTHWMLPQRSLGFSWSTECDQCSWRWIPYGCFLREQPLQWSVHTVSLRAGHLLFVPPINEVMVQIPYIYEVLVWKIIFGRITMRSFSAFYNQGGWPCFIFLEQSHFFLKEKRIFPPQVHLLHQFWTNGCARFRFLSSPIANVPSCGTSVPAR